MPHGPRLPPGSDCLFINHKFFHTGPNLVRSGPPAIQIPGCLRNFIRVDFRASPDNPGSHPGGRSGGFSFPRSKVSNFPGRGIYFVVSLSPLLNVEKIQGDRRVVLPIMSSGRPSRSFFAFEGLACRRMYFPPADSWPGHGCAGVGQGQGRAPG